MLRIALNGLLARPIRTALTALAIVLGVATIAAAFTLTDTMGRAADDLSSSAYDGTAAVVTAPSPFTSTNDNETLTQPTIDASDDRPRARGARRGDGGRRHHRPADRRSWARTARSSAAARGSASAWTRSRPRDAQALARSA